MQPIGSQWTPKRTTDTKEKGLYAKFGKPKPINQSQVQISRNKSPSQHNSLGESLQAGKGEEILKPPKMNGKRILDVIPSNGLDTVCGAQKKKGGKKTSFPPFNKTQQKKKKSRHGQWYRRKKKSRSFKEDQEVKGQWTNGMNNGLGMDKWNSWKNNNFFSGECGGEPPDLVV